MSHNDAPPHGAELSRQEIMSGIALGEVHHLNELLEKLVAAQEREPDIDQAYVVGGSGLNADAVQAIQLPRSVKHAEITFTVAATTSNALAALFQGNLTLGQAQAQHGKNVAQSIASNAIVTSAGGSVTVRDYLDGSNVLTVYFLITAVTNIYVTVRIRSLDSPKGQTEARRA